ncbi:MAG: 4'-phosphopantetheinyl transferase superfamily protein [Clostridiales bacterium]|nr:4'-phosphopantetheinyl transferase superfamily protein [Clostridiales bacterium]
MSDFLPLEEQENSTGKAHREKLRCAGVYMITLSKIKKIPLSYGYIHFPGRMKKYERLNKNEDKLRCFGAGALISRFVTRDEKSICFNRYGKPYAPAGPFFSISHSGDYVVLAVDTDREIGIDIQIMKESRLKAANKVFCTEEMRYLNCEDEIRRFYTLWTLKESVMKYLGTGFALEPQSFSVLPLIEGKTLTKDDFSCDARSEYPEVFSQFTGKIYGKTVYHGDYTLSVVSGEKIPEDFLKVTG